MDNEELVPGHRMVLEVEPVTRYSASWNMEYESTEFHMTCACGEKVLLMGTHSEKDKRLIRLEHSLKVLSEDVTKLCLKAADSQSA